LLAEIARNVNILDHKQELPSDASELPPKAPIRTKEELKLDDDKIQQVSNSETFVRYFRGSLFLQVDGTAFLINPQDYKPLKEFLMINKVCNYHWDTIQIFSC
jgi:hypothetical protein